MRGVGASSDNTYAVFGGGSTSIANNDMDYITIATAGNAVDFGNLLAFGLSAGLSGT